MNIPKTTLRFRIFNRENQTIVYRAGDLDKIQTFLSTAPDKDDLFIDDAIDNIEVDANEFLEQWAEGERPIDLQMF